MRVCARLDDRASSRWFTVKQSLRPGFVLSLLLFKIFFTAVINATYTHFKADKDIMYALMHLRKKNKEMGWRREANAGEPVLATLFLGKLYADDARIVTQSLEHLGKMMRVTMVVCAVLGLTISEVKTESTCLRMKGMPKFTVTFSVEASNQVKTKQTLIKTGSERAMRLYSGGGSCSRDLWRVWGIRDCRSA